MRTAWLLPDLNTRVRAIAVFVPKLSKFIASEGGDNDRACQSVYTLREPRPVTNQPQGSPLGAEITACDHAGLDKTVEAATRAIIEHIGLGPDRGGHAGAHLLRAPTARLKQVGYVEIGRSRTSYGWASKIAR